MTSFEKLEFYNIFEMTVYLDVVFFENLILDLIILLATGIICNARISFVRIVLASGFGSIFSIIELALGFNIFLLKIVASIIIVIIGFGYKNKKRFLKILGAFYLTSICFGGASFMFMNLNSSLKMTIIGAVVGFCLIIIVLKMLKRKFQKTCDIEIWYKGNEIKTKALIDSRKFIKRKGV